MCIVNRLSSRNVHFVNSFEIFLCILLPASHAPRGNQLLLTRLACLNKVLSSLAISYNDNRNKNTSLKISVNFELKVLV